MKKASTALSFLLLCAALFSCGSRQQLYSWYNYENVAYRYHNHGDASDMEALLKLYEKMDSRQRDLRQTVPPGFKAEYGCLLIKAGRKEEGMAMIKEEARLYPEAKVFVENLLKQQVK